MSRSSSNIDHPVDDVLASNPAAGSEVLHGQIRNHLWQMPYFPLLPDGSDLRYLLRLIQCFRSPESKIRRSDLKAWSFPPRFRRTKGSSPSKTKRFAFFFLVFSERKIGAIRRVKTFLDIRKVIADDFDIAVEIQNRRVGQTAATVERSV